MDVRVGVLQLSAEELMLLKCGVGENSWESLGQQGNPTSPSWRKSVLNIHWKDWCWTWNSSTLATWCEELTHLKRPWCWERLKAGREGDDRGWDGWMESLTQRTCVWANSGRWWRIGKPGVLQVHGVTQSQTRLKWLSSMHALITLQNMKLWGQDLRPHELQQAKPPCPTSTPWVHPNSCPLSWWCHPPILSSVIPFSSCLQSFPASGSLPMSRLFTSGGQSIRASASASVLPMNIQGWFP